MKMSPTNESKKIRLQNGDRAEPVEIWKARKFIEEHSNEELSLKRVARAVNISGNYLSEKFKDVTGVNFVDYIARVRFEKACDLLETPTAGLAKSHSQSGFNPCRNSTAFSKSSQADRRLITAVPLRKHRNEQTEGQNSNEYIP